MSATHMDGRDNGKIRVMLCDDHPMVLSGIRQFLSTQKNIEIVGEASDGADAITKVEIYAPDIVLMDITMPNMNGIEATRILKDVAPGVKVIILTMHIDREYVLQFMRSGAKGYIVKQASPAELIRAIETVHGGGFAVSPPITEEIVRSYQEQVEELPDSQELTSRENEILKLIAEGLTSKEIGDRLCTSARTVDRHRMNIMQKLNVHTVGGLIRFAVDNGMVRQR